MATHQVSKADVLLRGDAYYSRHAKNYEGRTGLPMSDIYVHDFGAPATASANAICLSQSITAGTAGLLNGATAGTLDVPRNVVAAWTGTAVMTVVGTDVYGETMTEASASGTSMTGKKAFKTITSVNVSQNVTGCTVGTGDVLGLPYAYATKSQILQSRMDGVDDAVTMVVADATSPATTTTGDVRGTVDFSTASDGTKRFMVMMLRSSTQTKVAQFGVANV
jgi:hypothetical protein